MTSTRITLPNEVMLGSVKELLAEGQQVIIMTKGFSMLPFIVGKRDSVLLEKRPSVQPGEIALAEISPGHYVLHRVREAVRDFVKDADQFDDLTMLCMEYKGAKT